MVISRYVGGSLAITGFWPNVLSTSDAALMKKKMQLWIALFLHSSLVGMAEHKISLQVFSNCPGRRPLTRQAWQPVQRSRG